MTNRKLLEDKIKQKGFKKSYLAEQLGVSRGTFSALLNNSAEFKASQIYKLCKILDIHDEATAKSIFFAHSGA